jgi:hypothetical protein
MSGVTLGLFMPAEFAAVALAAAGLAFVVGLRPLGRTLLVAVGVCVFVAPFTAALVATLPPAAGLAVGLVAVLLAAAALLRLLLGRRVCEMITAQIVSAAILAAVPGLWRSTTMRTALLGAAGGAAFWLLLHSY